MLLRANRADGGSGVGVDVDGNTTGFGCADANGTSYASTLGAGSKDDTGSEEAAFELAEASFNSLESVGCNVLSPNVRNAMIR